MTRQWDVFVSHASEDKRAVALPLTEALRAAGLSVWLDHGELALGDDLRAKISEGLAKCRFAVVILSHAFLAKQWPMDELRALMAREESGSKVVLPVRYNLTQQELVTADPLIGARVSIAFEHDPQQVVDAILSAMNIKPSSATCVVDFSHGQKDWDELPDKLQRDGKPIPAITRGLQEQSELLAAASLLVMPPPRQKRLERSELDLIANWVKGGGGLLLMGCYAERHHEGNICELAWRFDLEFLDNLVMPAGWTRDPRSMARSTDRRYAVRSGSVNDDGHPVVQGVRELAFISAASVRQTTLDNPELVVMSEPDSSLFRPLGRIGADGSRPTIDEYVSDGVGAVPLLVAKRWGKGRVIAIGTWKLFTVDHGDNFKLIDNAFEWLGASKSGGQP